MVNEKAMAYALDRLSARRAIAADRQREYLDGLYAKYPRLRELDMEIANAGALALEAVSRGDIPMSEASRLVREAGDRRDAFVRDNGIKYDVSAFYCHICSDTGYVGNLPCECLKKLQSEYLSGKINEESMLSLCGFDSFKLDYYPETRINGAIPRAVMRDILKTCREYCGAAMPTCQNLLMMGDAGLGKTHLALSIAAEYIKMGFDVIYCSAANIFSRIQSEYFENRSEDSLDSMKECDLLVLDDLGAEYVTPFVKSTLYDLVNTRINTKKRTVYTTNITDGEVFNARYGDGVASRLIGCCEVLAFIGHDIRLIKSGREKLNG